MTDAGRAAIGAARADGSWTVLESVEALVLPDDLAVALEGVGATGQWRTFAPTAQRAYLLWIATAKRPETRARRVAETARRVANGQRAEDR